MFDTLVGHTTVLPFGAPYTRFSGRLGPERAVSAGSWAKERIQAVQQGAGVTGNDVGTAMVAGVVRRLLRDRGELPKQFDPPVDVGRKTLGGQTRIGGVAADDRGKHRRDRTLPTAAVDTENPYRLQPAEFACSRPAAEMYWNGAHIEEMYPVPTVYDGQALNITACSYADRIGFGYAAGRDVVPDIDALIPLTEQCLTELESALGV